MNSGNSKINSKLVNRLLFALVGLLLIICIGGAKLAVGQLNKQASNLVSLKAKNQALDTEQANLQLAKAEIKKYAPLEKIAEAIVPQDKGQAETVRQLVNIAAANNIYITSIVFPTSSLGQTTAKAAVTTKFSTSQLTPVKGIPGVYVLPIQLQSSDKNRAASYSEFDNFLKDLEQNRRTSQVTSLSLTPVTNNNLTFSLTINEYIKPR